MRTLRSLLALAVACLALTLTGKADVITNGNFEVGTFHNTAANYDNLTPGSTDLSNWTVVHTVVWGFGAADVIHAPDGQGFVDLSGFGNASPNGEIDQTLSTAAGHTYTFSFDSFGPVANVVVAGVSISLTPSGTDHGWTIYTGTFAAANASTLLQLKDPDPNSQIVFVDDVSANDNTLVTTPEPGSILLFGTAVAALVRRRSIG